MGMAVLGVIMGVLGMRVRVLNVRVRILGVVMGILGVRVGRHLGRGKGMGFRSPGFPQRIKFSLPSIQPDRNPALEVW